MDTLPSVAELETKRQNLEKHIAEKIPGFEIKAKSDSRLMRFLGKVLFFTPRFMTGYKTTWYPKVYFPKLPIKLHGDPRWNLILLIGTLSHEYVHLIDRKRMWWVFNLLYLMPQVFALGALLAFLAFWKIGFFWALLCLVCLAPIPSIGRAWLEFRGYRMTMAVRYWLALQQVSPESLAEKFVKPDYYFMMPFKRLMARLFRKSFERIKRDELTPELREIKEVLQV